MPTLASARGASLRTARPRLPAMGEPRRKYGLWVAILLSALLWATMIYAAYRTGILG